MSTFVAFIWALAVLASFIGIGSTINRLLAGRSRFPWGLRASLGLAAVVIIGGVLNATGTVSRGSITALVGAGIMLLIADLALRRIRPQDPAQTPDDPPRDPIVRGAWALVFVLLAVQVAGSMSSDLFTTVDDHPGYFVFPQRMLQTGSMDPAPFSERRLQSLGGNSFLNALILAYGSEQNYRLVDSGIGLVISLGVIVSLCAQLRAAPFAAPALCLLALTLPAPILNATALWIPFALFLAVVWVLDARSDSGAAGWSGVCTLAILGTALCTIKSSLLPATGLLFMAAYGLRFIRSKQKARIIVEFAALVVIGFVLTLPWMLGQYRSGGTLLYPVLGRGFHATGWGIVAPPTEAATKIIGTVVFTTVMYPIYIAILAASASFALLAPRPLGKRAGIISMALAALVGGLLTSWAVAGEGHFRYGFPYYAAAVVCLVAGILARSEEHDGVEGDPVITRRGAGRITQRLVGASVIMAFLVGNYWNKTFLQYWDCIHNVKFALQGGELYTEQEREDLRRAQYALPPGVPILARSGKPFLLDFKRNPVFVADHPGSVSPPPGMPLYQGPEALADYLNKVSARYVIYSYAIEGGFSKEKWGFLIKPTNSKVLMGLVAKPLFDFQDNLVELGSTRRRIYDDGETFVLDLAERTIDVQATANPEANGTDILQSTEHIVRGE